MRVAWIFSAPVDLLSFTLPALLALGWIAAHPAAREASDSPTWLWVGGVLLVDVAHVWSTAFVTYLDPDELRRHSARYVLVPLGGWAAGVSVYALGGSRAFWTTLAYLAAFHFVRQQYGWMALYRARAGERSALGAWIDGAAIYAATLYPLIFWHAHLPRAFHWLLPGDFLRGLPLELAAAAQVAHGACLLAYAARALWQRRQGIATAWGKHLLLLTTAATWYVGIVATNSDYAFTLSNVLTHGIPYGVLVFLYARHRARDEATAGGATRRLLGGRLTSAAFRFLACLWAVAFLEELVWDRGVWHDRPELFGSPLAVSPLHGLLVPLLAVPQLTHYVLDGLLWRRSHNPHLSHFFRPRGCPGARGA